MDITKEQDQGEFERQEDAFRDRVSADGSTPFPVEDGRYHLYVSLACPWAHRTLITRILRGLEASVSISVVDPLRDGRGWRFGKGDRIEEDPNEGFQYLSEAYRATNSAWDGRVTVPVLWDKVSKRIVNNSEDDICQMLNNTFPSSSAVDLFPEDMQESAAELNSLIYEDVNNGVYRAGFAGSQSVHQDRVLRLFAALDALEDRLRRSRFLLGDRLTETDLRLFCTLVRFDAVYYLHFKCNVKRIVDYPNLWGFTRDVYQFPGISETVNLDHIKRHYYITHDDINPTRFVPIGPEIDFTTEHGRG
jgi:glutathionyl-hydroquinone reductase